MSCDGVKQHDVSSVSRPPAGRAGCAGASPVFNTKFALIICAYRITVSISDFQSDGVVSITTRRSKPPIGVLGYKSWQGARY